jgi:hypothetical protein
MKLFSFIATSFLIIAGVCGCKPDPVYPIEPILTFKEYIDHPGTDSLEVVFSFTDGDGDIGVALNGTDSNLVLTPYNWYQNISGFNVIDDPLYPSLDDSIMYKYRIPELTEGQSGLEGDIYITVPRTLLVANGVDTLQFNAFLLDQSDNKSTTIRTPEIILH